MIEDYTSIYNNDDHSCSLDTSPISDEGFLVKEDAIIENHEYLACPSPIPPRVDNMQQENEIIDLINEYDLLLDNNFLKIYNNPLYVSSPIMGDIMGQGNKI